MKKTRILLKPWLTELLILAQMFLFVILSGECDSIEAELVIKVPTILLMYFNHILLARYTDFYTKGF